MIMTRNFDIVPLVIVIVAMGATYRLCFLLVRNNFTNKQERQVMERLWCSRRT